MGLQGLALHLDDSACLEETVRGCKCWRALQLLVVPLYYSGCDTPDCWFKDSKTGGYHWDW